MTFVELFWLLVLRISILLALSPYCRRRRPSRAIEYRTTENSTERRIWNTGWPPDREKKREEYNNIKVYAHRNWNCFSHGFQIVKQTYYDVVCLVLVCTTRLTDTAYRYVNRRIPVPNMFMLMDLTDRGAEDTLNTIIFKLEGCPIAKHYQMHVLHWNNLYYIGLANARTSDLER
jgi:hypothetical protein